MKYYKLTDQNLQTYKGFQWEVGKWVTAKGNGLNGLCTNAWLHCYDSPLLAILHNPLHANIQKPRLFEVEVGGWSKNDNGLKRGFQSMRLAREVSVPIISNEVCVTYAILCAKEVYKNEKFIIWANNWLAGIDRTATTARAETAQAAVEAARAAAAKAAQAAVEAARAAAAKAAQAAAWAAQAAAWAAAEAGRSINLIKLAEKARN
jgi:hypothetical protein